MSTILRKGQIIPKRLGHITVHNKARHGIVAGAMIHWDKGEVRLISPGWAIRVDGVTIPRNNGTRERSGACFRNLVVDGRVNRNRISLGLAPIPTWTNLYARPPSLRHSTAVEYPEARNTRGVRVG